MSRPSTENDFWPRNARAQVLLHALDLGQAGEQPLLLVGAQARAVAAGLDRVAQPDALLVVGDVLDLVRDRPAVGLLAAAAARRRASRPRRGRAAREAGIRACSSGVSGGSSISGSQRRVADRLGAERVEPGGEVAVRAVRLDERHRGRDAAEQRVVDGCARRRSRRRGGSLRAVPTAVSAVAPFAVLAQRLEQPRQAGMLRDQLAVAALEERPPLGRHRLGVLEVLLEDHRGRSRS